MATGETVNRPPGKDRISAGCVLRWLLLLAALGSSIYGCYLLVYWWRDTGAANVWFGNYGNGASVLGLVFGASGFLFTIWTVLQTQRIEQAAREREQELERQARERERQAIESAKIEIERSREAIASAEQRTQEVIGRIATLQLRVLCEQARQLLAEGQMAVFEKKWKVAVEQLSQARVAAVRLAAFPEVTEEERGILNGIVRDLNATIRVIGRSKLRPAEGKQTADKEDEPEVGSPVGEESLLGPVQTLIDIVTRIYSRVEQALYR